MYIEYLRLKGYKRLMLSGINHFEITPEKPLQIILGKNGSGKSSVLAELSPVPGEHKDYVKGGEKYIRLRHRGKCYTLTSSYTGGTGKHSFECDQEEYNKGGTPAIQKELVMEHFGLNRERVELLLGITRFTEMSTAKRREWLTELSPVDLTFAFDMFKKLKGLKRDQDGVVRHHQQRMTRESQVMPTDGEQTQLRSQIQEQTHKLNRLFAFKRHIDSTSDVRYDTTSIQHRLKTVTERLRRLLTHEPTLPPELATHGPGKAHTTLEYYRGEVIRIEGLIQHLNQEYEELLQTAPKRDESLSESDIARLQVELTQLTQEVCPRLEQQLAQYQAPFPLVDLPPGQDNRAMLDSTLSQWMELVQTFPDNHDGRFSMERQQRAKVHHDELSSQQRQLDGRQNQVLRRLQMLKSCEKITCPSCDHQFQPGVSQSEIDQLHGERDRNHEQLQQLAQKLEKVSQYLTDFEDYRGYVNQFRQLVKHTPALRPLWDYCIEQQIMWRRPTDHATDISAWYTAMLVQEELRLQQDKANVIAHQLRYVKSLDTQVIQQLDQRRTRLTQQLEEETHRLRETQAMVTSLATYLREMNQYQEQLQEIATQTETFFHHVATYRELLFQEAVAGETQHTQLQLAQIQERLSKIEIQMGVLDDLTRQLEESLRAQADYQLLVKAMSPNDGLIGRYLLGFMQNVVKFLNAIIARVWTYPLEVLPSKLEKEELDYRFPLNVNGGAVTPPDISLGSASQRDIVDFAFRLLVMKFLRLDHMPLYLDELGASFDEEHRINLTDLIENMVEVSQVQQLFFVSHYVATHGAFGSHAEFCVIDPSNITVPKVYNQHVVIK